MSPNGEKSISTIDVMLPNSVTISVVVTLMPGLTVLDLKKLVVTEMVALGHGGGGTDNIRLVHKNKELFDTIALNDVGFEKVDKVILSHILVPPEINSVLDLQATRDFLHSHTRDRKQSASVGSLAMSRASTLEGGQKAGSDDASLTLEVKSEASPPVVKEDLMEADTQKVRDIAAAYPLAPVFRSRLYEYSDFLSETTPSNGAHRVSIDDALTIQFKVGKSGMIPCADALMDMGSWLSVVDSLPSTRLTGQSLIEQLDTEAALITEKAKQMRDAERKNKKHDPFSKEPSLAEQNAIIEADAMREAARKLAQKFSKKGSSYGDMEEYFHRDSQELTRRGHVKWTCREYSEAVLLVRASEHINHNAKYSAREASIAKKYETIGSVSIAQSRMTGGLKSSADGNRHEADVILDKMRYWWCGINDGYNQGDRHSWQRYTTSLPIACHLNVERVGGLTTEVAREQQTMRRNKVVDTFFEATGDIPNADQEYVQRERGEEEERKDAGEGGQLRLASIPCIEHRLPSRHNLGVGSFPKLEILSDKDSDTVMNARESYPLHWPSPAPGSTPVGMSQPRLGSLASKDTWESAQDDLQSSLILTIKPTQPLDPHTDYLLVLRNGLPVVPIGGTDAPLSAYRSAGVICEDKIIRFRTESKAHHRTTVKLAMERSKEENEKRANDSVRHPLENKDLSKVDWKAMKSRISGHLTSKKGPRDYLVEARRNERIHADNLIERYKDGKLAKLIDERMDDINPSYTELKLQAEERSLMFENDKKFEENCK